MNIFSVDEVRTILAGIGATRIHARSTSIRSCCPIHSGDNPVGFAVWHDHYGIHRATCHTRGCVSGSALEWVVAKVRHCSVEDATKWLVQLLARPDLQVPEDDRDITDLMITELPPVCLYDNGAWQRLVELYPYHPYWQSRGYSQRIVSEYGLTYRTLDNRAIIPVTQEDGSFVGIMERTFDGDGPKYLWQSPNAEKGRFLFGAHQALKRETVMQGMRVVFLAEGTLDCIKAADEGFPVVTAQTNRFSAAQAHTLLGNWDVVIVIPDTDQAGARLPLDVMKHAGSFMDIATFRLPDSYKDLDEVPQADLPHLFNHILSSWSQKWSTLRRSQRQRLMEVPALI